MSDNPKAGYIAALPHIRKARKAYQDAANGWTGGRAGEEWPPADLIGTPTPSLDQAALQALERMVYETTHLSPCKPNGDHDCTISAEALAQARATLAKHGGGK